MENLLEARKMQKEEVLNMLPNKLSEANKIGHNTLTQFPQLWFDDIVHKLSELTGVLPRELCKGVVRVDYFYVINTCDEVIIRW